MDDFRRLSIEFIPYTLSKKIGNRISRIGLSIAIQTRLGKVNIGDGSSSAETIAG
jgi:hypothetical protein